MSNLQNEASGQSADDLMPSNAQSTTDQPSNPDQNSNHQPSAATVPPNPQSQPQPDSTEQLQKTQHQQQQEYAQYIRDQQAQRYWAQQTHLHYIQQQQQRQQYAAYYQALIKQRQQQSYHHYYQQIAQQYGYPAMIQAINQQIGNNPHSITSNLATLHPQPTSNIYGMTQQPLYTNYPMNMNINNLSMIEPNQNQHQQPERNSNGSIILSCEEQPLLMAPGNNMRKSRKRRKRKRKRAEDNNDDTSDEYVINQTVSLDIDEDDDMLLGLDKDAFDKNTLINQTEYLPDIKTEFDEWLYFTKKLWQRQKKYKHYVIDQLQADRQNSDSNRNHNRNRNRNHNHNQNRTIITTNHTGKDQEYQHQDRGQGRKQ